MILHMGRHSTKWLRHLTHSTPHTTPHSTPHHTAHHTAHHTPHTTHHTPHTTPHTTHHTPHTTHHTKPGAQRHEQGTYVCVSVVVLRQCPVGTEGVTVTALKGAVFSTTSYLSPQKKTPKQVGGQTGEGTRRNQYTPGVEEAFYLNLGATTSQGSHTPTPTNSHPPVPQLNRPRTRMLRPLRR
jgi:hypothetical protein